MTIEEAAQQLGLKPATVQKHIERGRIKAQRRTKQVEIDVEYWDIPSTELVRFAQHRLPPGNPHKKAPSIGE